MNAVVTASAERCGTHAIADQIALLRKAAGEPSLCSVRASGRPESYLSRVFTIDEASGELVVDLPRAPMLTRALVPGGVAEIELTLRHVRLGFEARVQKIAAFQGSQALFLAMPDAVRQRQRRELGRVGIPKESSAYFTLDAARPQRSRLRLNDIGPGGACIAVHGSLEEFPIGQTFEHAELAFPDGTAFECVVRISHASVVRQAEIRLGLQFTRTSTDLDLAVAQFIEDIARGSSAHAPSNHA